MVSINDKRSLGGHDELQHDRCVGAGVTCSAPLLGLPMAACPLLGVTKEILFDITQTHLLPFSSGILCPKYIRT